MAYSESLAQRVWNIVGRLPGISEKKMFGGVSYLLNGNMACGVIADEVIVRVGEDGFVDALNRGHARPFDMTGRPMKGWVVVSAQGVAREEDLRHWVQTGVDFATTLPPK